MATANASEIAGEVVRQTQQLIEKQGQVVWGALQLGENVHFIAHGGFYRETGTQHSIFLVLNEVAHDRLISEVNATASRFPGLTLDRHVGDCFLGGQVRGFGIDQQIQALLASSRPLHALVHRGYVTFSLDGTFWTVVTIAVLPKNLDPCAAEPPVIDGSVREMLTTKILEWQNHARAFPRS